MSPLGGRSGPDSGAQYLMAASSLALAGSLWGTGFLFGKIAMTEMTVSENVAFRLLTAALTLSPIVLRGWAPYRGRKFWFLLLAAAAGIPVQFLIQFRGLQLTTVSHASLIFGALPVLLAASSTVVLREHLRGIEWAALAVSALGAGLIALSSRNAASASGPHLQGDLLVFLSMFAAAAMTLCSKRLVASHGALQVTAATIILGTILLVTWLELWQPLRFHFSGKAWGAALAQGLLATAGAYLFWNWGLTHMPASKAGVFLNLEPVVGTVLGVTILHERLASTTIVGGLLIIGAAVYFSLRPHPNGENRP